MQITFTKGNREDFIAILRGDGTRAETRFPHKGPVPHDAVHLLVEAELGLRCGFWGMVAEGRHPEELAELAKLGGHASAKRAEVPAEEIVELLQAERLVEVFEADLWGGQQGDCADLVALGATACDYSHVAVPETFDAAAATRIRKRLAELAQNWVAAPHGHAALYEWE